MTAAAGLCDVFKSESPTKVTHSDLMMLTKQQIIMPDIVLPYRLILQDTTR